MFVHLYCLNGAALFFLFLLPPINIQHAEPFHNFVSDTENILKGAGVWGELKDKTLPCPTLVVFGWSTSSHLAIVFSMPNSMTAWDAKWTSTESVLCLGSLPALLYFFFFFLRLRYQQLAPGFFFLFMFLVTLHLFCNSNTI